MGYLIPYVGISDLFCKPYDGNAKLFHWGWELKVGSLVNPRYFTDIVILGDSELHTVYLNLAMKNCPFQDHLLIKNEIFHAIAILEDQGDPGGISICIVAESWILFLSFSHRSLVKVKQENSEPSTWRGH